MVFGGTDSPCAQLHLMSYGGLSGSTNTRLSKGLSECLTKHLNIPIDRYYIEFIDLPGSFIGYAGATF